MMLQFRGARRRAWITGLVFLVLIAGLAIFSARAAIESQIKSAAAERLSEAGYGWLDVSASGRSVTVEGAVFSEQDKEKAEAVLRDIWGVGKLESRLTVAVRERPYTLVIARSDEKLKLRGSVPNEDVSKTIIGVVNANFPGIEIDTDLKIDPNMAESERWLSGIGFALAQLKHVSSGRSVLSDTELSFEGRAAQPGAYETLINAFRDQTPESISLSKIEIKPPLAQPFTLKVQVQDGNVILGGHAPSEQDQASMVLLATGAFPNARIIDRTVIANGEPENWMVAARLAVRALNHLAAGSVTLAQKSITFEGVAKSAAAREAIASLKRMLPPDFDFHAAIEQSPVAPARLLRDADSPVQFTGSTF